MRETESQRVCEKCQNWLQTCVPIVQNCDELREIQNEWNGRRL